MVAVVVVAAGAEEAEAEAEAGGGGGSTAGSCSSAGGSAGRGGGREDGSGGGCCDSAAAVEVDSGESKEEAIGVGVRVRVCCLVFSVEAGVALRERDLRWRTVTFGDCFTAAKRSASGAGAEAEAAANDKGVVGSNGPPTTLLALVAEAEVVVERTGVNVSSESGGDDLSRLEGVG